MANPGQELSSINFESMLGGPLVAVVNAQAQAALSSVNFIKSVGFKAGTSDNPEAADTGEPIYVTFKYPKEVAPYQPAVPGQITGIRVTTPGSGYTSAPTVTISGGGGSGATATATTNDNGEVTSVALDESGSGYTSEPTVTISGGGGSGATAQVTFSAPVEARPAEIQEMKLEVPILTILPIPFIRIEETTIDFNAKINSMQYKRIDDSLKVGASAGGKASYPFIASASFNVSASYQRDSHEGNRVTRQYSMAVHIRAIQDELPAGMEKVLGILEDAMRSQPVKAPEPHRE